MMKFCCDTFASNYKLGAIYDDGRLTRELFPNIKIVKLSPDPYNRGEHLYRYLLVCGFLKDNPPVLMMKYCPFCGVHLFDYYEQEAYINEQPGTFGF